MTKIITPTFYRDNAYDLAIKLLGKVLCRKVDGKLLKARIVETECYMGLIDDAAHTYHGKITNRTKPFYYKGGVSYVYLIYGMYNCFNIVANDEKHPEAVLIRAVEPIDNVETMISLRYKTLEDEIKTLPKSKIINLTNGPGKLCRALNITREDNLLKLNKASGIYLEDDAYSDFNIVHTKRIGIDYANLCKDKPWRFYIENNPYISRR